jgi:hypothetical protein
MSTMLSALHIMGLQASQYSPNAQFAISFTFESLVILKSMLNLQTQ